MPEPEVVAPVEAGHQARGVPGGATGQLALPGIRLGEPRRFRGGKGWASG